MQENHLHLILNEWLETWAFFLLLEDNKGKKLTTLFETLVDHFVFSSLTWKPEIVLSGCV